MTIELNIFNLAALASAFIAALWVLVKVIVVQQEKAIETRFKALADSLSSVNGSIAREQETTQRLERELLQFKAELPRDYVRREDFIRAIGTIETKIDNMALRVERAFVVGRSAE